MTGAPSAARGPWLLLACSLALAACGYLLLDGGQRTPSSDVAAGSAPHSQLPAQPPSQNTLAPQPSVSSTPPQPAPTPPPRGEGRAADLQIQQLLEKAWPADLPAAQERQLRKKGALLLYADATGVGRDRFPDIFSRRPAQQVAPAFSRFRIQAAIARQDKDAKTSGRAVVHLVWAAADRGGTYTDGRISDLYFHRPKGGAPWTALPLNP
ncbi:hypothetical protein [Streptomyces sp. NPDC058268]|uniref:hypothetical protein n=1 Tax=Streptomyces sp. NPDC058268 TaxID=3346413 RepID=UPI0036E3ECB3